MVCGAMLTHMSQSAPLTFHLCVVSEPTTGLDSTAAFSIVNYIAKIAKVMNLAVIMTIHQPSALVGTT